MEYTNEYRRRSEIAEELLAEAFSFENKRPPVVINDVNYWLFGELEERIPEDYCDENPASMIAYQLDKICRHVDTYDDCYIPFLMPWYGTGVLASGFGLPVQFPNRMDPVVELSQIRDITEISSFTNPDPYTDGLMPRVLATIRVMRSYGFPVGVTDCQGPLTTALQLIGYDKMIYWMNDAPDKIHAFMEIVTESLIEWIGIQKKQAEQPENGGAFILGIKIPEGFGGVWISDDDSVIFGPKLYREFVVPYNSRILERFGGGGIHYCGTATQHIENFALTKGLTCIHNLSLDNLHAASKMYASLKKNGVAYILGDFNVAEERTDDYYETIFRTMGPEGLIVVPYIAPAVELNQGAYKEAKLDPVQTGRVIECCLKKHLQEMSLP